MSDDGWRLRCEALEKLCNERELGVQRQLVALERLMDERKDAIALALDLSRDAERIRHESIDRDMRRQGQWQDRLTGALLLVSLAVGSLGALMSIFAK